MNRSERENNNEGKIDSEILRALLISPQQSVYNIQKNLKKTVQESNYATVWRHVKKLNQQGLVIIEHDKLRKDGKLDKRNPKKAGISPKGLATLIIEEDLTEDELRLLSLKILQEGFGSTVPPEFWEIIHLEDLLATVLVKIKPKVNLRYFDQTYFMEIFSTSLFESMFEALPTLKFEGKQETVLMALDVFRKFMAKEGFGKEFEEMVELGKKLHSVSENKEE
jgi:hypothetical protein